MNFEVIYNKFFEEMRKIVKNKITYRPISFYFDLAKIAFKYVDQYNQDQFIL